MLVGEQTYEEFARGEDGERLELHRDGVRAKPPRSLGHNQALRQLNRTLVVQLDPAIYEVSSNASRVYRADGTSDVYYIPDLAVIPVALMRRFRNDRNALEVYREPLPLVIEGWSPSTGDYDADTKIPDYRARGDAEIWRLHPFEPSLRAWRRQPDGVYSLSVHEGAVIEPLALPGVVVDLDLLFVG